MFLDAMSHVNVYLHCRWYYMHIGKLWFESKKKNLVLEKLRFN